MHALTFLYSGGTSWNCNWLHANQQLKKMELDTTIFSNVVIHFSYQPFLEFTIQVNISVYEMLRKLQFNIIIK